MKTLLSILFLTLLTMSCKKEDVELKQNSSPGTYAEPKRVYIYAVIASPTNSESVSIKNNSGISQDISHWTLGDENDPTSYSFPNNTILNQGKSITINHSSLGFQINNKKERLFLKDKSGNTMDEWSN